jgi:hypothetical protein
MNNCLQITAAIFNDNVDEGMSFNGSDEVDDLNMIRVQPRFRAALIQCDL